MSLPPIPNGFTPLPHQVAGHMYGQGKTGLGCLKDPKNGILLKPVQRPPKGLRELSFYETLYDDGNSCNTHLLKLRNFVPNFYGTFQDSDHVYMKLEDCAHSFIKPNIMDIKMGADLYHPEYVKNCMSARDLEMSHKKFPPGKVYGYSMLGMRVYDPQTSNYVVHDSKYLRSLQHEEVIIANGLEIFYSKCGNRRNALIRNTIKKLQEICDWFQRQTDVTFYSSSLLLIYEGDPTSAQLENKGSLDNIHNGGSGRVSENLGTNSNRCRVNCNGHINESDMNSRTLDNVPQSKIVSSNGSNDSKSPIHSEDDVDVRMIDFAHSYFETKKDENYLLGLQTLLRHLTKMLPDS